MALVALQNKVILKLDEEPSKSRGGIEIPEQARKPVFRGTVVAVGPGKVMAQIGGGWGFADVGCEVGDYVHFADYHGGKIEHEGQEFLVIDEDDILAVVPKGR